MEGKRQGKGEDMFPIPSTTQLTFSSLCQQLNFHRQSQSSDSQYLTNCYEKHWFHTDTGCAIHLFLTFSGTTAPLLSEEYAPPCKTEPRLWLVSNFMYHSLQCIILKHRSRLFSWQRLNNKKIPPITPAKSQLFFHDSRNHCNIVKTDEH